MGELCTWSLSNRTPHQEESTVFVFWERQNAWISLSVYFCPSMHVCMWGVVLPFPALGMFKASSCAVRMCLSLCSKNTCSAFYQWAELGRLGAVQGWAQIIKHQWKLICPDWNWLGVFAGLVWWGLVGHSGITVLKCSGSVLLKDWSHFVVRLNWS